MVKNSLKEEIIEIFKKNLGWKIQTVRDQISRFKIKECPNCTQNAAAYILGRIKGVKVWGKLCKEDRDSIPSNVSQIVEKYNVRSTSNIIKSSKKKWPKLKKLDKNYESEFISEAEKNASAYLDIYVIENILRKIILDKFGEGKSWWTESFVSKKVFEYAERIMIAESNHPWIKKRGNHPLYYVGLEELKKIITKYWGSSFEWIGEREKFMNWVDELIPIRNMVAHNVKLEKEEITNAETKSKWLVTLINTRKQEK